jgi:hypothetical protein
VRTPTWREIEEFCRRDGWEIIRSTDHVFFRKVLADGTVLETHRSFASDKTMSPGRFLAILRHQIQVSPEEFWETLRVGRPVQRPGTPPVEEIPAIPAWIVRVLLDDFALSEEQVTGLSQIEAQRLVEEFWSRTRSNEPPKSAPPK